MGASTMDLFNLVARASNYGTYVGDDGTVYYYDKNTAAYVMAWYIVFLIIWVAWFFLVYIISFIVFFVKERKRKHQGFPFRTGHVFWKAFTIASGLWFWIWIFKKCGCCGAKDERRPRDKAGMLNGNTYNQIEAGTAWYGVGLQQQQQQQQQQQELPPQQQRFEPMGYVGSGGIYQHPYAQQPQQSPPQKYDAPPQVGEVYHAELH